MFLVLSSFMAALWFVKACRRLAHVIGFKREQLGTTNRALKQVGSFSKSWALIQSRPFWPRFC